MKAVVLGGYGNFGRIICTTLACERICEVVVTGRDAARAGELARAIGAAAAAIDADASDLDARLAEHRADLVISTAGPFQGRDYRVARAAIAAGAHYVDLADGREFVCGITALDAHARERDRLVVAGASSVPALSAAVVDRYAPLFARLDAIDIGISTAQRAPGVATVRAVLGYAGKPIAAWRAGAAAQAHGWQGLRRHEFPAPVGTRWLCDCDVPELELFPRRYPGLREVRFGAGVERAAVQWTLWLLAGVARVGHGNLSSWAAGLHRAGELLAPWSTGRSAMFVELRGVDAAGRPLARHWALCAGQDHGARIPAMAAVALARALAAGALSRRGAMPCVGLIGLDRYLAELGGLDIRVHERA